MKRPLLAVADALSFLPKYASILTQIRRPSSPPLSSAAQPPGASAPPESGRRYFLGGPIEWRSTGCIKARSASESGGISAQEQVEGELGVRHVADRSVCKAGNRLRITAQLIEGETGPHVRAERHDRSLGDIFAPRDEITLSTVGAIEPSLRDAEIEPVKHKRLDNLGADDFVPRAAACLRRDDRRGADRDLTARARARPRTRLRPRSRLPRLVIRSAVRPRRARSGAWRGADILPRMS